MRWLCLFLPLLLLAEPVQAQRLDSLRAAIDGRSVRINNFWSGRVEFVEADAIGIRTSDGSLEAIPMSRIREIDIVEAGRHERDTMVGILAGGVAGALLSSSFKDNNHLPILFGAGAGAALGMLADGSSVTRTLHLDDFRAPRWDRRILGRAVRVKLFDGDEVRGRVVKASGEDLIVQTRGGNSLLVERMEMTDVQVHRYRPELALLGMVGLGGLGAVVGAGLGVGTYEVLGGDGNDLDALGPALIGMTIGGIAGLVMGFKAGNSWTSIPREPAVDAAPRVSLSPVGPGGPGLTVSLTF